MRMRMVRVMTLGWRMRRRLMRRRNMRGRRKCRRMRKVDWMGTAEAEGRQNLGQTMFPIAAATAPQARRSNATAKRPNA